MKETRAVAEMLLQQIGNQDYAALEALFTDDIDWRLSWPDDEFGREIPWIRSRRGATDVADHFRSLAEHNEPANGGTTIETVLVDGGNAVITGTIRNKLRPDGQDYQAHFALHLTVSGGKITRYHVYEDSLAVWRAWKSAAT